MINIEIQKILFEFLKRKDIFLMLIASEASKLYLTNGYLEKSCILETKHFGHMVLGTKRVCFDPISRYME